MQLIDSEQCELPFRPSPSRSPPKSRIGRPAYTKRAFNTQPLSPASLSTSRSLPMLTTEPFLLSGAASTAELPALPAEPEPAVLAAPTAPAAPAVKSKPQIRVKTPNASTLRLPSVRAARVQRAHARAIARQYIIIVTASSPHAPGPDRAVFPHEPTYPQRDLLFADGLDDEGRVSVPRELGLRQVQR